MDSLRALSSWHQKKVKNCPLVWSPAPRFWLRYWLLDWDVRTRVSGWHQCRRLDWCWQELLNTATTKLIAGFSYIGWSPFLKDLSANSCWKGCPSSYVIGFCLSIFPFHWLWFSVKNELKIYAKKSHDHPIFKKDFCEERVLSRWLKFNVGSTIFAQSPNQKNQPLKLNFQIKILHSNQSYE